MRKRIVFLLLAGLMTMVGLAAGQAARVPAAPKSTIIIRVDPDVVKPGAKIALDIKENFTSDGVDEMHMGQESQYGLEVRLADGKTAPLTERGKKWNQPQGSMIAFNVRAGTVWKKQLVVSDIYDMTQPGKYEVEVNRGTLKSNVVTVTVAP
jgi:hypothetical protein